MSEKANLKLFSCYYFADYYFYNTHQRKKEAGYQPPFLHEHFILWP